MISFVAPGFSAAVKREAPLRPLLLTCAFAAVSAGILIAWTYLSRLAGGKPLTAGISPLYWEIPNAAIWILLFPFIYHIVRRNPLTPDINLVKFLSIQAFFAFLFAAIHLESNILLSGILFQSAGMPFEDTNPWCPWSCSLRMSWRILFYCLAVAVCYAVEFFDRTQRKKFNNSRLQAQIRTARLNQMKIRIDPVFVQRTLSDVASMMQTNTRRAVDTITRLGAFFRLLQKQNTEISLARHAEVLRSYFRVETERSEGRIRASICFDRELAKVTFTNFPVQSLVYAFYGYRVTSAQGPYKLRLLLRKKGTQIMLALKDNFSWASGKSLLAAELHRILRASEVDPRQYRIRPSSRGVCIFIQQRSEKELSQPPSSNLPDVSVWNYPLWLSLSVLAFAYFLSRGLLTLLSAGGTLAGPELFRLSTGVLLCVISVPGTLLLARKLRLQNKMSFVIHIVISVFLASFLVTTEKFLGSSGTFDFSWRNIFLSSQNVIRFPDQILLYWGVLLIGNAFWYYRSYTRERIRSSRLESDLSGAQLKALEMQLHPHFLFNTLHVINGLILTNQSVAAKMLRRLQDFLQMTLQSSEKHLVTFGQELKFLECYLDIQKIRFGNRLKIKLEIDPETLVLRVPQLILQPIVENAIRHGFSGSASGGEIVLHAQRQNGSLRIAVQDNGPGLSAANRGPEPKKGLGLQNSALRLYHLYGDLQQFSYGNRPGGGFEVKMKIPVNG